LNFFFISCVFFPFSFSCLFEFALSLFSLLNLFVSSLHVLVHVHFNFIMVLLTFGGDMLLCCFS
jgi:hypothetical protein